MVNTVMNSAEVCCHGNHWLGLSFSSAFFLKEDQQLYSEKCMAQDSLTFLPLAAGNLWSFPISLSYRIAVNICEV